MNTRSADLLTLEEKFIVWWLLAAIPRALGQHYLFKWGWAPVIFDAYYVQILHFTLFFIIEALAKVFFKVRIEDEKSYYLSFFKYWVIIFPAVPIVSYITGSSYVMTIGFFGHIPTFMVDNNFLPLGMIFVIPLIFYFSVRHLMKHTGLSFFKTFLLVAIANIIAYVVYYQWILNFYYHAVVWFSFDIAVALYSLLSISVLIFIKYKLVKREVLPESWLKLGFLMFYLFFFILIVQSVRLFLIH